MPIFINPPVKVQRMNIIQTILTKIHTLDSAELDSWTIDNVSSDQPNFVVTTLEDYWIKYQDGTALLLDNGGFDRNGDGSVLNWNENVFEAYGELRPGISQIRLRQGGDVTDPANDIVGTIDYHPTNPQLLSVTIDTDTLPQDTRPVINAFINPQKNSRSDQV